MALGDNSDRAQVDGVGVELGIAETYIISRAGKSTEFMYLSKSTSKKATQVEVNVLRKNCT